jgi:hypothetical protein
MNSAPKPSPIIATFSGGDFFIVVMTLETQRLRSMQRQSDSTTKSTKRFEHSLAAFTFVPFVSFAVQFILRAFA